MSPENKKIMNEVIYKVYLGKPSQKKNDETWEKVQTSFTPSLPPSTWEVLTVNFFIAYLGFKYHEMDFEINLFFPSQKCSDT